MSYTKGVLILFGCGVVALYRSARIHQIMQSPTEVAGYIGLAALVAWLVWGRRKKKPRSQPWMREH